MCNFALCQKNGSAIPINPGQAIRRLPTVVLNVLFCIFFSRLQNNRRVFIVFSSLVDPFKNACIYCTVRCTLFVFCNQGGLVTRM